MIISKSNIIDVSTIEIMSGAIASGSIADALNNNFAKNIVTTNANFALRLVDVEGFQYVGLHGLSLPIGTVVNVLTNGWTRTFTTTRDIKNLVFYNETASTLGNTQIAFNGPGTKIFSYIQAGEATKVSWGVNSGQPLHYLASNYQNRATTNQMGMPVSYAQETISPRVNLTMRNMLKSWVRTDLQDIIEHHKKDRVLSILDYEDESRPDESVCGFDLNTFAPTAHSQTKTLVDVSMSMRVSA